VIVVDSAAVVDALTGAAGTDELRAHLAAEDLHAPGLVDYEVVSALRGLTLRGQLSPTRAEDVLTDFEAALAIGRCLATPRLPTQRERLGLRRRLRRPGRGTGLHPRDARQAAGALERARRPDPGPVTDRRFASILGDDLLAPAVGAGALTQKVPSTVKPSDTTAVASRLGCAPRRPSEVAVSGACSKNARLAEPCGVVRER